MRAEPGRGVLTTRLEVWGDPVDHSRSPDLHTAAYAALGLPWEYGRRRVTEADFDAEYDSLGAEFRGLSVTYPLKAEAFAVADVRDARAERTGAVNTLLRTSGETRGYNTDVGGIALDLAAHGVHRIDRARIVGAGATATSALVALAEVGATQIEVVARRSSAAARLESIGAELGVTVATASFADGRFAPVPVTIAAVPGGTPVDADAADGLAAAGGVLYDVVYGQWPTDLARGWQRAGGHTVHGLGMLLHQALLQVRVFVAGDVDVPLPDEERVLAAMRAVLPMGD